MGKDRNTVAGEVQQALIKRLAKKLAYRFGSAAKEGSGLTARGFVEAFKNRRDYDELSAYLYGPESVGMEPFYGKTNGPSHESMIGTRDAREYRGLLNPEGEYVFPASVQPVLEQAANVGSNIYINADQMPYTGGYRYDAANHPVRITRDGTGALVGSAADLYDFDPGYLKRYDAPAWQVIPMAAAGTPYIVRQDNIPIRFVGDNASEDDKMKASKTMEAWGSAETPHRKKKRTDLPAQAGGDYRDSESIAIENTLLRSGMPILEPATVIAEYPGFRQYGPGGWIEKLARSAKNVARRAISKETRLAESYSSQEYTFDEAYSDARSKGQKTFFWNGDYYNTDYEGEHGRQYKRDVASGKAAAFQAAYPGYTNPELRKEKQEELDTYGITNEQTQNKSFLHERALKNLDFYGDYDWKQAVDALVLNHAQRAESDTSPENLTHYQQLRFYLGYPLLRQDTGLARRGSNGYGAPVKISAFRPTTGTNSTPYYYTFLRNPYGNKGLTAGSVRDKYERLKRASEDYLNGEFYKDAEKYGLDYAVQRADENMKRWDDYFDNHVDDLVDLERLENFIPATYRGKFETKDYGDASGLGNFTQYGTPEYRSFYDLWDIGLGQGNSTLTFGLGKPFEYYDRRYHDDETKQNIANPDIDSLYSNFDYSVGGPLLRRFGEGGNIHIKPSHRGRLTELKDRTGKTEAELYNDGNPAHKKMVVFARNSRKWKHADGGLLHRFDAGGDKDNDALAKAIIARVNQEEAAKARAEGAPIMGEKPLESEDYLLGLAAIGASAPIAGTASAVKEAAPLWGRAGLRMLKDLPAFEFVDRLPTLFGGKRMTELGGDATQAAYEGITGNHNLSDMSRALVRMPGEFIAGVVPGVAGDVFMRTGSNAVLRSLNNRGIRIDGSMDYLEPLAHETNVVQEIPKPVTAKMPIVSTVDANAYEIADLGGGYMLKSLMRGNPLEKQISKQGTVSVNNIRALINKGSKVEQAVVDKVLASEEFAGKKAIDYNKFRKAVQDELIIYDRTPDSRWEDYGMRRIGLEPEDTDFTMPLVTGPQREIMSDFIKDTGSEWRINYRNMHPVFVDKKNRVIPKSDVDKYYVKWLNEKGIDYVEASGTTPETFTFSSTRIPSGSAKHYNENTLGHSRTYTTADEPDVLHVMESQSDWAQSPQKMRRAALDSYSGLNGTDWLTLYSDAQANYLADNYTSRQIQENLRYAAEKGQKKMRYPTRETAAKIEGYSKSRSQALADNPKLQEKYDDLRSELAKAESEIYKKYVPEGYIDPSMRDIDYGDFGIRMSDEDIQIRLAQERASEAFDKTPEHKKMVDEIIAVREKINPDRWLEENVPEAYLKEHETILKKYDAFPKQYQKLFKGADVRIVTDHKGNTWYEVDVPENYLQQEWAYADGGHLNRLTQSSIIQRYGKDKILSAIAKMKQSK